MGRRQFTLEDQGNVNLGIQVKKYPDGTIHLNQPHIINSIINDLHLQENTNPQETPTLSTCILHMDADGEDMKPEFHYHSVIGKLNFLEKLTRPNIS